MRLLLLSLVEKLLEVMPHFFWWVRYSRFRQQYALDNSFRFNGNGVLLYGKGEIIAGSRSYIGGLSTLQAVAGQSIKIGIACKLSHNVRVYTQSAIADSNFNSEDIPQKFGNVTIGDYCWIGANVLINPGVSIGDNSIVGANSVVTKDIPPFEIWGGVPAKLIRKKSAEKFLGKQGIATVKSDAF